MALSTFFPRRWRHLAAVSRFLGCVTRTVRLKSKAAGNLPAPALDAVDQEMRQMEEKSAFNLAAVKEWDEVVAQDPTARRINGQMLIALKDEQNPGLARYKARLVAIGCLIRSSTGARIM